MEVCKVTGGIIKPVDMIQAQACNLPVPDESKEAGVRLRKCRFVFLPEAR
jgi:hypothetical protein